MAVKGEKIRARIAASVILDEKIVEEVKGDGCKSN